MILKPNTRARGSLLTATIHITSPTKETRNPKGSVSVVKEKTIAPAQELSSIGFWQPIENRDARRYGNMPITNPASRVLKPRTLALDFCILHSMLPFKPKGSIAF
jgi:hypothetical protein